MVAYSFRPRFVEPILWGRKSQTIRAHRNRHARPGEQLQLYTGMRTKSCRLILRTTCIVTVPVGLQFYFAVRIVVGGCALPAREFDAFARSDGFSDLDDMRRFWAAEHPGDQIFDGVLIHWRAPLAPVEMGSTIEGQS